MIRIAALILGLASPALASQSYILGPTISTQTGKVYLAYAGTVAVAASSQTISTPTITLDGAKGGVNASSGTFRYGVVASTFTGNGAGLTGVIASSFTSSVNGSMLGDGTPGAPLGVKSSSVAVLNASGFVLNSQLDPSSVTKQGLITLGTLGGISTVTANASLSGLGTASSPLGVNSSSVAVLNASGFVLNSQLDGSSITKQGNTFNGNSQLIQTTSGGLYPALNGSNITNITAANISAGSLGAGVIASSIAVNSVGAQQLQAGAVSTATITGVQQVTQGGTGATTASGARSNLSAAQSGANQDIVSMSSIATISSTFTVRNATVTIIGQDAAGYSLSLSSSITLGGCVKFGNGGVQCSAAAGGTGDVVQAGNNSFTGLNSFGSSTTFNGLILGNTNIPIWTKYTVPYTSFTAAATTSSTTLVAVPIGTVVHAVKIRHTTAFSGGAISAYTISVGTGPGVNSASIYASAFNVFQVVTSTAMQVSLDYGAEGGSATWNISAHATSTGANLSAATAGSVDIWIETSKEP